LCTKASELNSLIGEQTLKPDIPPEQLERIQPLVDQLLTQLRRQARTLPLDAESALIYELKPEDDA